MLANQIARVLANAAVQDFNTQEPDLSNTWYGSDIWNPKGKTQNNKKKVSKAQKRIKAKMSLKSRRINRQK